jgi:hypothetical protein
MGNCFVLLFPPAVHTSAILNFCTVAQLYVKEDEMGRACSMNGGEEECI